MPHRHRIDAWALLEKSGIHCGARPATGTRDRMNMIAVSIQDCVDKRSAYET
jgi:hypothetical protein